MSICQADEGSRPQIPAMVLQAVSKRAAKLVLVIGAGCSRPLPMARECAETAYESLVADGLLKNGECADPTDLSILADTVFAKFESQAELVQRLPRDRFRRASANPGYLMVAALLRENAISSVLTLNYDLAIEDALTKVCAVEVEHIAGPAHVTDMGSHNIVYLHRNVNETDFDKWILRASALAEEWKNGWEELMAQCMLTSPVVVFAGLGSPAEVLIATTSRIRAGLNKLGFFQVDPAERSNNAFAKALGLSDDEYIRLGWNDFALRLSERVVQACLSEMKRACVDQIQREGFAVPNVDRAIAALSKLDIVELGTLRAEWLLKEDETYTPHGSMNSNVLSDLLVSAEAIIGKTGAAEVYFDKGVVEFRKAGVGPVAIAMFASGRGQMSWATVENVLHERRAAMKTRAALPALAVIGATTGIPSDKLTLPQDVIKEAVPQNDIRTGIPPLNVVDARDINLNPNTVDALL